MQEFSGVGTVALPLFQGEWSPLESLGVPWSPLELIGVPLSPLVSLPPGGAVVVLQKGKMRAQSVRQFLRGLDRCVVRHAAVAEGGRIAAAAFLASFSPPLRSS